MNNYKIDRKKWAKMTIFEQMGNISSEVGRSFKAKEAKDAEASKSALIRALDLFDATVDVYINKKSIKAKEILRSKDQYLTSYFSKDTKQAKSIQKYFMQYAIASRINS